MGKYVRVAAVLGVLATLVLAAASFGAGRSHAGNAQARQSLNASNATATVHVNFVINRFVRQGRQIVAMGAVVAKYRDAMQQQTYTTRKAFSALVKRRGFTPASEQRICNVLDLRLGPLHLALLGLIVDLSEVHLTITADSEGGILGRLFCGLVGGASSTKAKLNKTAMKMSRAAKRNGLNRGVAGFTANISSITAPTRICEVLDLTLGPLDLNLLGLMVHLDPLRLHITADSEGGILGSLFCSLAGPPPPPPPAPSFVPSR